MRRRSVLRLAFSALALAAGAPLLAQRRAAKPLEIVVYGGSGAIGSRIVAEALARGHEVTVVDRNPRPPPGPMPARLTLLKGDAFDPADVGRNIAGKDVLITAVAVRPTPTRDFYVRLVSSLVTALRAQKGHKVRLMVVGGASSLETGDGRRVVDTLPADLPEGSRNEVLSMVDALDWLRNVKDVSWTFFSPAATIEPGARTGRFRLGDDRIIRDEKGESRISMEDYAVALLDEIEKPAHVNRRFTIGY
jgi:putative NADH-flavin reductase